MLFPDDPQFSQDFAQARLAPILPRLLECVQRAWRTLVLMSGVSDTAGPALSYNGARAHVMNALVVEEIRREFPANQEPDYATVDGNGFLELHVRQGNDPVRIDLRFKKMAHDGTTMNIDTPAQNAYRNQLPFTGSGDARHVLRLSVSWRWNAAATDLEDVQVIYVKGYESEWAFSILEDRGEGSGGIPIPLPSTPPSGGTKYRKAGDAKKVERSEGAA